LSWRPAAVGWEASVPGSGSFVEDDVWVAFIAAGAQETSTRAPAAIAIPDTNSRRFIRDVFMMGSFIYSVWKT
jgi:hypothetical protein